MGMNVAAMISGEPRFTKDFDVFLENLMGYNSLDWYFMLWKQNTGEHWAYKSRMIADCWREIDHENTLSKISQNLPGSNTVAGLEILDQDGYKLDREIKNKARETVAENCWLMYQGIKLVNNLRNRTAKPYDLVVRTRPDLSLSNKLDLNEIKQIVDSTPNTIVMPNNYWFGYGPFANDIMAIGKPEVMDVYCDVINTIPRLQEQNHLFHPETMLGKHLELANINVVRCPLFEVELRHYGTRDTEGNYVPDFGRWA